MSRLTNRSQLVCLPFAGAGASFFNEWKGLQPSIEILAVQLPGREKRFADEPHVDVQRAADEVAASLKQESQPDVPTAIFGHSLGAVLAFEVARRMATSGFYATLALVVSGSPDPWTQRSSRASDLADDAAFIAKVTEFSGYAHEALEDPLMRELLLPALRADVQMHENYRPGSDASLEVPVLTVRGTEDSLVAQDQVERWSKATKSRVTHAQLPGGHMYFAGNPGPLLDLIAGFLPVAQ
jgi:surfactin synthase thioesterase subunit